MLKKIHLITTTLLGLLLFYIYRLYELNFKTEKLLLVEKLIPVVVLIYIVFFSKIKKIIEK